MKKFQLDPFFEVIIKSDDVTNPKPHHEPLELAMKQLKVNREEVIFVGDTAHDLMCGKNTNVITYGVAWSFRGAKYLQQYEPDYILERVSDLVKIIKEV